MKSTSLKLTSFDTKLGSMIAVGDTDYLYCLEFSDKHGVGRELEQIELRMKSKIEKGTSRSIQSIQLELQAYFNGTLKEFKTPLYLLGTAFQKQVWKELRCTPYGQTRSYAAQAQALGKPTAYRAVANANGANQMVIVIPCHRIISSTGGLGGYSSGIERKKWLLDHELKVIERAG